MKKLLVLIIGLGAACGAAAEEKASARIAATTSSATVSGTVNLTETKEGLKVDVQIAQAPAGEHGFHIHEFGLCEDEGKAAGSHYNPSGRQHGNLIKSGPSHAHAGDLGNITIGQDGRGSLQAVIPGLTLAKGKYNVAGRAFILHEKPDDFSQPAGNAGGRIGCGPILLIKSE